MTEIEKRVREISESQQVVNTGSKVISTTSFSIPLDIRKMIAEVFADKHEGSQENLQRATTGKE